MSRAELRAFLDALSASVGRMPSFAVAHIERELRKVYFQRHVSDEIYRCTLCGVEDTHALDCPANLIGQSAESAVRG